MNITLEIPDGKTDILLSELAKRYQGLRIPETNAQKKALLAKLIQQQVTDLLRQTIVREKQAEAVQTIKADADLAETSLEAEMKLVAPK
jgi:hypothetical protein